ncbi:MAG: hypothetical protein HY582_02945 [Candidatus Omnitrophica bacterium]|nr:hypothetical protein [Candidatus Omnitrophota bacterium]
MENKSSNLDYDIDMALGVFSNFMSDSLLFAVGDGRPDVRPRLPAMYLHQPDFGPKVSAIPSSDPDQNNSGARDAPLYRSPPGRPRNGENDNQEEDPDGLPRNPNETSEESTSIFQQVSSQVAGSLMTAVVSYEGGDQRRPSGGAAPPPPQNAAEGFSYSEAVPTDFEFSPPPIDTEAIEMFLRELQKNESLVHDMEEKLIEREKTVTFEKLNKEEMKVRGEMKKEESALKDNLKNEYKK